MIPVVQGLPVKRLNGQRARRIRNGIRGRRGMAASGRIRTRVRPEQTLKKRSRSPADAEERDWAAEPVFRRVTINGVPTLVRIPGRTEPADDAAVSRRNVTRTRVRPRRPTASVDEEQEEEEEAGKKARKSQSGPERRESQRQSEEEEPLLFSENFVDVNILSMDDR